MRAVIYDPEARANLRLADVDEPAAAESEAVIEVRATALNFGEVHFIDRMREPGEVPGWDAAGVVVQAAADWFGPPVGSRVVGFHGAGGWAQRRAVPTENLAILPDSVATTINFEAERLSGVQKSLAPFNVRTPFAADLGYLVELLAAGEIDPQIGLRTSWHEVSDAAAAMLDRRVAGKAVLDVG